MPRPPEGENFVMNFLDGVSAFGFDLSCLIRSKQISQKMGRVSSNNVILWAIDDDYVQCIRISADDHDDRCVKRNYFLWLYSRLIVVVDFQWRMSVGCRRCLSCQFLAGHLAERL